jgi:hypothetical protein
MSLVIAGVVLLSGVFAVIVMARSRRPDAKMSFLLAMISATQRRAAIPATPKRQPIRHRSGRFQW